ncbi:L-carnitine dehydratase/bile acid-inducible protein F [Pseudonocardia sp. Ae168_Ps1]|uniref:CaiB/BaiF CoA transferase family protein n=1 Tax=unclassified Pseudonocardia TaxID=2619320 RepID=UPI00094AD1E1|nr:MULTISPECIES: CaiB/BaiF CoA-transferase family protein [unclassified Pseudonocardia]OLL76230.1 L-carnitine dehydratase/bile acid-inducible protein F [Pseudonocardia sp. Ae150A_Ps1]OLL82229.1 L-carnitine dehydratase/bile acid-inducible protein F [Pseudonocardia sp. Ae168_Ps1]OLL83655.1 L-carnitine dehydratase/bile acid-inducible protein F [Pseudonocardia sp. Ae263_Ps1]OLL90304.1 L-carnitine dehydratase/bile acid-inducible protein F [Pseudonocardia sp. Ae356_Ps1]
MTPLPLDGVTVVALEQAIAIPFATRQLADLGARVIKIERPGTGDFARQYDTTVLGQSSHFVWVNRGKESVELDVKDPDGLAALRSLLDEADVFASNLAPGAVGRLGLDGATLSETHPRLVVCELSGYGEDGPYGGKKAYDLLVQCEAGLPSVTGTPDEQVKAGIPVADIAGGMYAFSGILSALYERERTGRGQVLEVTLFEALAEWMGYAAYFSRFTGSAPPRSGLHHAAIAPYGPFATADGAVYLSVQNDREWRRFCEVVLGEPELADRAGLVTNDVRYRNRGAVQELVEQRFATLTAAEAVDRLDRAQIANSQLRDVGELFDHPQLAARDRIREVGTQGGPVPALLPPITVRGREPRMAPVPALGEHTDAVRAELSARTGGS